MAESTLIFTGSLGQGIERAVEAIGDFDRFFLVTDANVAALILPRIGELSPRLAAAPELVVKAGEESKSVAGVAEIWSWLIKSGATRRSVVVAMGGGMITDLAGFAASTFMRGVRCINVPTTLLGAIDAAVGGKTAINFEGMKNMVGTFHHPEVVVVDPTLFATLTVSEVLSGWGEMIKHALLDSRDMLGHLLNADPARPFSDSSWNELIDSSIVLKRSVVEEDFKENGRRKILNLGHTAAHAFEAAAWKYLSSPLPHGYAVAWGLIVDLVLSRMLLGLDSAVLYAVAAQVKEYYPPFPFKCDLNDALIELMTHDKKNRNADEINFTLLRAPGDPAPDCNVGREDIAIALDITRDLLG